MRFKHLLYIPQSLIVVCPAQDSRDMAGEVEQERVEEIRAEWGEAGNLNWPGRNCGTSRFRLARIKREARP